MLLLKNILRNKKLMVGNIDVHSHILFGVEDCARTIEESKEKLELEYKEGVHAVNTPPHFRRVCSKALWRR